LDADEIKNFLMASDLSLYNEQFLTVNKHIDTIFFEKSINMFQDLNNLYFIFYEKTKEVKNSELNSITKKIYLGIYANKKTIKKQYKA
jgi:hypothetical protein